MVSYCGESLIPGFGGNRPVLAEQEGGRPEHRGGADGVKRVLAVLAVVVVVASVGDRRADLAAERRPAAAASGDQRVLGRAAGAGRALPLLRRAEPHRVRQPADRRRTRRHRRHPVQLSVPPAIAAALWVLVRSYEDGDVVETFRPRHHAGGHDPDRRSAPRQADRHRGAAADAGRATRPATRSRGRTPNGRCGRTGLSPRRDRRAPVRRRGVGPGGVPSPNGLPPNASRPCGVSQFDRSGPFGTICVGLMSLCTM